MDRFWLCEVSYPKPEAELQLLEKTAPQLPENIRQKMVEYANEIRQQFMGEQGAYNSNSIEVTLSTRTLLRWAELTLRFQPLSRYGVTPVLYALDRSLGFRAAAKPAPCCTNLPSAFFLSSIKPIRGSNQGQRCRGGCHCPFLTLLPKRVQRETNRTDSHGSGHSYSKSS